MSDQHKGGKNQFKYISLAHFQDAHLSEHVARHHGSEDPQLCHCGKMFKSLFSLKHHLKRTHKCLANNINNSYKCDKCDKTFNRQSNLIAHTTRHQNEKPHSCVLTTCESTIS